MAVICNVMGILEDFSNCFSCSVYWSVSGLVGWSVDPSFCRYFEVHRQFLQHCPVPLPKCLLTCRTQDNSLKLQISPRRLQISPRPHVSPLSIHSSSPLRPELYPLKSQNGPLSPPISPVMPQISPLKPHISPLRIRTPPFHLFLALPISTSMA